MFESLVKLAAGEMGTSGLPSTADARRQPQVIERLSRIGRHLFDTDMCLIIQPREGHWINEIGELLGRFGQSHARQIGTHSGWIVEDLQRMPEALILPFVARDPGIRFAAWIDVANPGSGQLLSIVLADREPRCCSMEMAATLEQFVELAADVHRSTTAHQNVLELAEENRQLRKLVSVDGLTGLWNRDSIFQYLNREIDRCERQGLPISLVVADLDHFKRVNDEHGHLAGDEVLREVAGRLKRSVRGYDAVGRLGGEEFLIVMSDCNPAVAAAIAERVQHTIRSKPIDAAGYPVHITISQGLVSLAAGERLSSAELFDRADRALYRVKNGGRDGICSHDAAPS